MITVSTEKIPTKVYQQLRINTGLSPKSDNSAETGLANTLHHVLVQNEFDEPIAIGRLFAMAAAFARRLTLRH